MTTYCLKKFTFKITFWTFSFLAPPQGWGWRVCGNRCPEWHLCLGTQHGIHWWVLSVAMAMSAKEQTFQPSLSINPSFLSFLRTLPGPEEAEAGSVSPPLGWHLLCASRAHVHVIKETKPSSASYKSQPPILWSATCKSSGTIKGRCYN